MPYLLYDLRLLLLCDNSLARIQNNPLIADNNLLLLIGRIDVLLYHFLSRLVNDYLLGWLRASHALDHSLLWNNGWLLASHQ